MCLAGYHNHPQLLLWALSNGADINARVPYCIKDVPLSFAARLGQDDIISLLLTKGANQHAHRPHMP